MIKKIFSTVSLTIMAVSLPAMIFLIAVVFLMYGSATGLESVFLGQPWLGWIITGVIFILIPIIFLKVTLSPTKKIKQPEPLKEAGPENFVKDLVDSLDIKGWAQKNPYQATGAAALAGFLVSGRNMSEVVDHLRQILITLLVEYIKSKKTGPTE